MQLTVAVAYFLALVVIVAAFNSGNGNAAVRAQRKRLATQRSDVKVAMAVGVLAGRPRQLYQADDYDYEDEEEEDEVEEELQSELNELNAAAAHVGNEGNTVDADVVDGDDDDDEDEYDVDYEDSSNDDQNERLEYNAER